MTGPYQSVRTTPLFRTSRSDVMSVRPCTRAVAAISRSAKSGGNESPSCSDSIATSTVKGSTSRWGADAAVRNHNGHGPKSSSTTILPRARCQAASFKEMAESPMRSCAGREPNAPRARRLRRGWSSTDQIQACVSSTVLHVMSRNQAWGAAIGASISPWTSAVPPRQPIRPPPRELFAVMGTIFATSRSRLRMTTVSPPAARRMSSLARSRNSPILTRFIQVPV